MKTGCVTRDRLLSAVGLLFAFIPSVLMGVGTPGMINYQGRVAVGGVNFDGIGLFRFGLVDAAGSTTYWSNDGTSINGKEPVTAVALTVTKGLYSVLLGDATVRNMTVIPATVFTNPDVRLRVWFDDGSNGSQLLAPDQRIAAVGYAMMAGKVPDGTITSAKIAHGAVGANQLATHAVQSGNIASGAVGSSQLASGAAAANLNGIGQSGVASGGLVLSATENTALLSAGYVRIGMTTTPDAWLQRVNGTLPGARYDHRAVWTGSEMIVWGGWGGTEPLNDGGRYDPSSNVWTATTLLNAPGKHVLPASVWSGTQMIVWGGAGDLPEGGRYDPAADIWRTVDAGGPAARGYHTMVWTGSEMIVWGGLRVDGVGLNDTWSYSPGRTMILYQRP